MPSSSSHWSHVLLKTTQNDDSPITPKVFMLPKISRDMPVEAVASLRHFPHITDLQLAGPHFDEPGKVYLLLANDVAQDIVLLDFRRGAPSEPLAIKTIYGWAILGRLLANSIHAAPTVNIAASVTHAPPDTDELLNKFWETKENTTLPFHTPDEMVVLEHYVSHYVFLSTGRY